MHPVPERMRTLSVEKFAAKKVGFRETFFSARVFASEKTRIWKRPLCIIRYRLFRSLIIE